MKIEDKMKQLLNKVASGEMDTFIPPLAGGDFGIFISAYVDGEYVRLMKEGYSQIERNLKVTVESDTGRVPEDTFVVGWMGRIEARGHGGVQCRGIHNSCQAHCPKTSHGAGQKNCKGHPQNHAVPDELDAPELKYELAVAELKLKQDLLDSLAKDGFGLALLHGHNNTFTFTKLPEGYVSVVSNGVTRFLREADIRSDPAFVPNTWRSINGELRVAGGYSQPLNA
ncbi:MAG: hypothetical protein ABL971_09870 [Vicinamibacterales bacterium]